MHLMVFVGSFFFVSRWGVFTTVLHGVVNPHFCLCLLYYLSKFIIRFTVSPSDVLLHLATT